MRLKNKVALVTGSSKGIGRGIAIRFAEEGAAVVLAARTQSSGQEAAKDIVEQGGRAIYVKTDQSKNADVRNVIGAAIREYGKLDILVNNAAIFYSGPLADETEEMWDEVIDVNLKGLFLCTKYAIPEMLKVGGGSIINISSCVATLAATFDGASYTASKAGIVGLTRKTAVDYARFNIRANCILPGVIATEMAGTPDETIDYAEVQQDLSRRQPIRRVGVPTDIANAALFLACEESSFVTGALLPVDGGATVYSNFGQEDPLPDYKH